jgi:hypothetical protein
MSHLSASSNEKNSGDQPSESVNLHEFSQNTQEDVFECNLKFRCTHIHFRGCFPCETRADQAEFVKVIFPVLSGPISLKQKCSFCGCAHFLHSIGAEKHFETAPKEAAKREKMKDFRFMIGCGK